MPTQHPEMRILLHKLDYRLAQLNTALADMNGILEEIYKENDYEGYWTDGYDRLDPGRGEILPTVQKGGKAKTTLKKGA